MVFEAVYVLKNNDVVICQYLFLRDIVFAKETSSSSTYRFHNAISETNASYICIKAYHYSITFSTFVEQHSYMVMGDYATQIRYVDIK